MTNGFPSWGNCGWLCCRRFYVELCTTRYKHLLRRLDECQTFYGQEVFLARVAGTVGVEQFYKTVSDGRVQVVFKEVFAVAQVQGRHHLPDGTRFFANGFEQFPYRRGSAIQLVGYLSGACGELVGNLSGACPPIAPALRLHHHNVKSIERRLIFSDNISRIVTKRNVAGRPIYPYYYPH